MIREYGPKAMEGIAQRELLKYNPALLSGEPCATPIEEMIELHYGIILQYRNLSKKGIIHGITVFEDSIIPVYESRFKRYEPIMVKAGTILIDRRLLASNRSNRLRFTLAHELAHYIIHGEYYLETDTVVNKLSSQSDMRTEKEADELGASLLMPMGRLRVAVKRYVHQMERKEMVICLAGTFQVSIQAMEIRLRKLGLS